MNLIILPGNSKEYNDKWLTDSKTSYESLFETTITHIFKHWTQDADFDLEFEVNKLANEVEHLTEYVMFAKSIGVMVVLKAIFDAKISPVKCIFVGSPFEEETRKYGDIETWLKNYSIPTLFIQQTDDMFFKHDELKQFLEVNKVSDYILMEIEGSNHAYDNYAQIKGWLKEFIFS